MGRIWWRMVWVVVVLALVAAACGSETVETGVGDSSSPSTTVAEAPSGVAVSVAARAGVGGDPLVAGEAITAFAADMFGAARDEVSGENLTLSPTSIAIALAMVEPGAVGEAQTQFRDVLHIDDPAAFHGSMNALERDLENRVAPDYGEDSDGGELTLRIANAAYLQTGYPFEAAYLDTIGSNYGPVLNEVDFPANPDAVAHEINGWVADQTEDRITDLIADGVLTVDTVFALVNALYMNASWLDPFDESQTRDDTFTLLDGTGIDMAMMQGHSGSSSRGDGWVGATKAYTGGLYIQFILPDEGRFDEIADNISPVLADYPAQQTAGATLRVPKFESRTSLELTAPLNALGLTAPYLPGNLLRMADDPRLRVDRVIHETFIAIDEQGTEAAAATAVIGALSSGPASPPVPVILDRPFLYRIMDRDTGTTLFIGQILDPTT